MSTIIIITPPPKKPQRVQATATGAKIVDGREVTLAEFSSLSDAQAYLRSIQALQGPHPEDEGAVASE